MHFSLIHLDAVPTDDEEVYVVLPGIGKTTIAVRLDSLPHFLPLLEQAIDGEDLPRCSVCAARLPAGLIERAGLDVDTGEV